MDCLATPQRRKLLFGLLYLSEGAPIGFIWLGLPTRLRALEVPVDQITWLMAFLILPWTLKFLWAPLIDLLRGRHWGFKHWILASQFIMALTIIPLCWLDLQEQFLEVTIWLMAHAFAAATQDVAIDALCIRQSQPSERGALNGWMQCGVLVGRAAMGGGALVLEHWIGFAGVIAVLISLILCSAVLLCFAQELPSSVSIEAGELPSDGSVFVRLRAMIRELVSGLRSRGVRSGFLLALVAPAAFKSLEAVIGPFLIDHGYSKFQIGKFTATVMIGGMIAGSLLAGRLAHRFSSSAFVKFALFGNLTVISMLALADLWAEGRQGTHLFVLLALAALTIGWFTVALYNWLMNLTSHHLAATQFTAFMAATNACEAWSTALLGRLQVACGYPMAILLLCGISAVGSVLILRLESNDQCS